MHETGRRRDEAGVAFPSPLVMLSVVAVTMAGIAFVATRDDQGGQPLSTVSQPEPTTPVSEAPVITRHKPKPAPVKRAEINVEVYNNSGIKGLAGRTATKASTVGWNVVGSDNWVGTIPAPTIYYGPRLEAAARQLGKDLGISRVRPSVAPMRPDRLTVILTAAYA
jgi:peptidoglycan hydrolase-like protein with peptidoglycan-binding domain